MQLLSPPEPLLENVACPLCGQEENLPFAFEAGKLGENQYSLGINKCKSCHHCYVSPRLSSQGLDYLYNVCYEEGTRSKTCCFDEEIYYEVYAACYGYAKRLLPKGGRVLDVGCGTGNFLAQFKDDPSFQAEGCDISEVAVQEAVRRGHCALKGDIQDAAFSKKSYDVISMLHLLEHVQDPIELLTQCSEKLRPGGYLIVVVPNYYFLTLANLVRPWLKKPKRYLATEHLHNFSPGTLALAVAKAGLKPVEWRTGTYTRQGSWKVLLIKQLVYGGLLLLSKTGLIIGGIHLIAQKPAS
jgi:2-polyprenyl-3-methyl-5-hydroxy-6-metoxy-1,4-benzoquinol methylase